MRSVFLYYPSNYRYGKRCPIVVPPLTYLEFHLVFVIPPILLLAAITYYRDSVWKGGRPFSGLAVLLFLALVYTTPWDNLLIAEGVWWYGEGTTVLHFWEAPLGEYLFFLFQPILTALWLFQFPKIVDTSLTRISLGTRAIGIVAGLSVSVVGYLMLGVQSMYYMGAILFWAGPILAIQWGFGWTYLWKVRKTVAIGILVPTLYLWLIDRIAIGMGIWVISDVHTVGITLLGLPIEEALFFFLTNVFAVQTLVLYMWLCDRVDQGELEEWKLAVQDRFVNPSVEG